MDDEKLIEDVRLLAHWEPTKERRVEICEAASKRLSEFYQAMECGHCGQPRWAHCTDGGGTQDAKCNFFSEKGPVEVIGG